MYRCCIAVVYRFNAASAWDRGARETAAKPSSALLYGKTDRQFTDRRWVAGPGRSLDNGLARVAYAPES